MIFNECDLDKSKLPIRRDVMQYLLFLRNEKLRHHASQTISFKFFFSQVSGEIWALWEWAAIPVISVGAERWKIEHLVNQYRSLRKSPWLYNQEHWNKLHMIGKCRCGIESKCKCKCIPKYRIPNNANEFFIDQCKERLLTLDTCFRVVADAEIDDAASDASASGGYWHSR